MKLAALYSGGKDSTFAVMRALEEGHEVTHLVTIAPENSESYMFHYPCIELTKLQAESMGIKHIMKVSKGQRESELGDLKEALASLKGEIEGVVCGAVSSEYQKTRVDTICSELGLKCIVPMWKKDAYDVLKEEIDAGLDILITAVSTGELDKRWLGKKLNAIVIEELKLMAKKNLFNVQFEGGEAETFVLNCPIFEKRVVIGDFEKKWDDKTSSGYIVVRKASLAAK